MPREVLDVEEGELELRKFWKIPLTHFPLKKGLNQNRSPPNPWVSWSLAPSLFTKVMFFFRKAADYSFHSSLSCPSPHLRHAL